MLAAEEVELEAVAESPNGDEVEDALCKYIDIRNDTYQLVSL